MDDRKQDAAPPVDVPEADALEDRPDEVAEGSPQIPVDVPEADALEQAREADLDEDDRRP